MSPSTLNKFFIYKAECYVAESLIFFDNTADKSLRGIEPPRLLVIVFGNTADKSLRGIEPPRLLVIVFDNTTKSTKEAISGLLLLFD